MKLSERLDRLKRAAPKHTRYGQMYAKPEHTKRAFKRVTLYTLFLSAENTHILRPHVFQAKKYRTPAQWSTWFSANLEHIHRNAVLPGLAVRTNKQWAVERIIGWTGDAKSSVGVAKVDRPRNKAKRQRRTRG